MYSVGVDIGGTFTDFTVYDHGTGAVHVEKRLTTPSAPESAVLAGLQHLQRRLPGLVTNAQRVNHATTLVANAILERKGLPTALLTTGGFRDVLEMRLGYRYNVYDLFIRFPEPIVPRHHRYGVAERLYSDGDVHRPLIDADIEAIGAKIAAAGIQSVAICFLHAYRNPALPPEWKPPSGCAASSALPTRCPSTWAAPPPSCASSGTGWPSARARSRQRGCTGSSPAAAFP